MLVFSVHVILQITLFAATVLAAKNNILLLAGHLRTCGIKPYFCSSRTAERGEAVSRGMLYQELRKLDLKNQELVQLRGAVRIPEVQGSGGCSYRTFPVVLAETLIVS